MKEFYKNLPVMKYLFFVLGIFLFGTSIIVFATSRSISSLLCTVLGAIFIAGAIFYGAFINSPRISTRVLRYIVVMGTFAWIVVCLTLFIYGNSGRPSYTEDALIVVGCGDASSSKMSKIVEKRLDKAVEYLKTNPYAYVVVSGTGKNTTNEADIMAIYLQNHDIDSSRIIKETNSKTMQDRFVQSKKLIDSRIDDEYRCVTITSAAQALRSQLMARRCGLRTTIIGVRTDFLHAPSSYMHEMLTLIRFVLFRY